MLVDGEPWFFVDNKEKLNEILDKYKKQYIKNIDNDVIIKNIKFKQNITISEIKVLPGELISLEEAEKKIYSNKKEAKYYEVKKGDNFWDISRKYDMKVEDLALLNPEFDPEKIYPGDKLLIEPKDPVLDIIIEVENTVIEPIPFKTKYIKDSNLYRHEREIIKKGVQGEKKVAYKITFLNGIRSSLDVINEKVLKEPVTRVVKIGTKRTVSRHGRFNFGVVRGRISSSYGWRVHPILGRRDFHDGIDIAAPYGRSVYAYTTGKVVQAGWKGYYGKSILIDHGNGFKTRYAHLSKIYVTVNERVKTGQKIGTVGSTGLSTGPHLHFEIIKNGKTKNPLNYL